VPAIRRTKAARQGNLFQVRNTMPSSSSATQTSTIDDLLTAVDPQYETIVDNIKGFEQLSGGNYAISGKTVPHASCLTSDGSEDHVHDYALAIRDDIQRLERWCEKNPITITDAQIQNVTEAVKKCLGSIRERVALLLPLTNTTSEEAVQDLIQYVNIVLKEKFLHIWQRSQSDSKPMPLSRQ
jgi:hypothetical protein